MNSVWRVALACVLALLVSMAGCKREGAASGGKRKVILGIIAKSQDNTVFQVAHAGFKTAARELGPKYNAEIDVRIMTPPSEDATKQAEAIDSLVRMGAAGITIACSDANIVKAAIDRAADQGVAVMCFDSDAPGSKRFCYYGTDDIDCGHRIMRELAKIMGEKGTVAVLSGNPSAPNLKLRIEGIRKELAKYPNMKEANNGNGVFFLERETPSDAAERWKSATRTTPGIEGWAMVGGWPLFVKGAVEWEPGKIKVVSVDALPPQLEYVESGTVQLLLAQDCYGWGAKSVELLMEKIIHNKAPDPARVIDPLKVVTKDNAKEMAGMWDVWLRNK